MALVVSEAMTASHGSSGPFAVQPAILGLWQKALFPLRWSPAMQRAASNKDAWFERRLTVRSR